MQAFVGKQAPDFTAATVMPDNNIETEFHLRQYTKNSKAVLFFYPYDFTFVCPSEIIAFNNRLGEFLARNTKVIAVSNDSRHSHLAWKNLSTNQGGIGKVSIPMVSDFNKNISRDYNVLNDDGVSLRGTFLIDEHFIVRHISVNDFEIGRNVDEILRIIDAVDYHAKHGEVCPAGWGRGDEAIVPSAKGIADYLSSNADKL